MTPTIAQRPGVAVAGSIVQRQPLLFRRLWIDQPTLVLVEAGYKVLHGAAGSFRVEAGQAVALAGGQAFDVTNYLGAAPAYRARWLAWERGLLEQWRAPAGARPQPVVPLGAVVPAFAEAFTALTRSLDDPALPDAVVAHRALEMLVWLEGAGRLILADTHLAPRVRRLLAGDPAREWRSPEVAAQFAMSEASLRRHLAAEDSSLSEILLDVRMSTALTLLQSTAQPVTRIAGEVGYQSPSQFAVRFRRRFGCSPSDVRRDSPRGGESARMIGITEPAARPC
jgi:AraC-like DNA-binding protein